MRVRTFTSALAKFLVAIQMISLFGCGPKAFTKGDYEDVNKENLLDDEFSETDMQAMAKSLVGSMVQNPAINNAKSPPVVLINKLENLTSEHIDTESIMDKIRVEVTNSGKLQFINKQGRQDAIDEYNYESSGMVNESTKKGAGGQIGADFRLDGRLTSIVKEVGKDKKVYYKITLNLTNHKTNLITWTGEKELRKSFKKKSIGL